MPATRMTQRLGTRTELTSAVDVAMETPPLGDQNVRLALTQTAGSDMVQRLLRRGERHKLGTLAPNVLFRWIVRRQLCVKRNHTRNQPLIPHFIDFALEVINIVFRKVSKSSLLGQIITYWQPPDFTGSDLLRSACQAQHTIFHLVERPDACIHSQFTHFVREVRIVIPAFRARIERMNKRWAADGKRFADGIHTMKPI